MKMLMAVLILAGFGLGMMGCNTTKGVGQDMKAGGQSLENSADRHGATP